METTTQGLEEEKTPTPGSAAKLLREVRVKTRRKFSPEDKIRIILEGFRKEKYFLVVYCSPDELKKAVNNSTPHESLDYVTPNDVYAGKNEVTSNGEKKKTIDLGTQEAIQS